MENIKLSGPKLEPYDNDNGLKESAVVVMRDGDDDNCGMNDPYRGSGSEQEPKTVRNAEIMKKIVNLLAEKKCTVQDAEDILQGTLTSVYNTATVRMLNY